MRKKILLITGWLLITLIPVLVYGQGKTLTGVVFTGNNVPVQGATVAVINSSQTTASDVNGKFTLSIPENAVIVITAIGYKTQTIKISGNLDLHIKLQEDVSKLDEVVVTGLATSVKRKNLANAVAEISANELNGTAPAQTFDEALDGKISGANINANSGAPGGGVSIKLRGVTSIYGNTQPLYVVDGVYLDNSSTSSGLNAVTLAAGGGSPTSNQDNPSSRIADIRAEDI